MHGTGFATVGGHAFPVVSMTAVTGHGTDSLHGMNSPEVAGML
jgi:hypothetical protein